jgi:hypothetical protein
VKVKGTSLLDWLPSLMLAKPACSAVDATRKIGTIAVASLLVITVAAVWAFLGTTDVSFHIASSPAEKPDPINVTFSPGQALGGVIFSM